MRWLPARRSALWDTRSRGAWWELARDFYSSICRRRRCLWGIRGVRCWASVGRSWGWILSEREVREARRVLCCFLLSLRLCRFGCAAGGDAESGARPVAVSRDRGHAYDFLLAGGWTARRVAIGCYLLTAGLGLPGWFGMLGGMRRSFILGLGIFGGLLVSAGWLGAARLGAMKHSRYRVEL